VTAEIAIKLRKIGLHTIQASIDRTETSFDCVKAGIVEEHSGEDGNDDSGKTNDLVHFPLLSADATITKMK
jgi:hypothetical protein